MRKLLCCLLLALCLTSLASAEVVYPEWTYPIEPLTLLDAPGYLVLTNRSELLDEKFVPNDLVNVTLRKESACQLRKPVHEALTDMFKAAEGFGYKLYVKSAYRSYQTQNTMYYNRLERLGRDDGLVAYPGSSDHQTGMGIDVLNKKWMEKDGMNYRFAQEAEAQWMAAHCHEYGFVIRYLEGKEDVTGIAYEPWHLRYVGMECAAYMMKNNLTLEEFTEEYRAYIAEFEQKSGATFAEYCAFLSSLPPAIEIESSEEGEIEFSLFYDKTL